MHMISADRQATCYRANEGRPRKARNKRYKSEKGPESFNRMVSEGESVPSDRRVKRALQERAFSHATIPVKLHHYRSHEDENLPLTVFVAND